VNREEYGRLLADIGRGQNVGIAAWRERNAAEMVALEHHSNEFWGLLCLGDAVHQFYRDTLEVVRRRILEVETNDVQTAMVNWHIVSFERFAVAFRCMARAYYFETIALARDLWEIALSLAALKQNVVTLDDLLAKGAKDSREMQQMSRKIDARIRRVLLQDNPALDQKAHDAVNTFLTLANLATHKSKLHFGLNFSDIVKGKSFDLKQAALAQNVFYLASWSLITTLPYLEFALSDSNSEWNAAYHKVQQAFEVSVGSGPDQATKAWPTVLDKVFGRS